MSFRKTDTEKIYNDNVRLVAFVVSKYVDNEEDIKDLVNDVFLSFFSEDYSKIKDVKSYLTRSGKNTAINFIKRKKQIPLETIDELAVSSYSDTLSSARYIDFIESMKKIISEEEIRILILHELEGYTFNEIGEMLKKNANSVKTTYRRVLKKLRDKGDQLL